MYVLTGWSMSILSFYFKYGSNCSLPMQTYLLLHLLMKQPQIYVHWQAMPKFAFTVKPGQAYPPRIHQ